MFIRSILALSLSCIFTGSALAATTTSEQPLNPTKVSQKSGVKDPIDPLAVDTPASSALSNNSDEAKISAQEQKDLNQAASTLQNLEQTEDVNADIGSAPASSVTTTTSSTPAVKASWTLDGLTMPLGMKILVKVNSLSMRVLM